MPENSDTPNPERPVSDEEAANMMRRAISDTGQTGGDAGAWDPPQPEELAPLMVGYTIDRLLGRGGMGAVYHGVQENLDREVAIKLLPPELGQNPEFQARFKREAKSMAKLNHPNIVQIFDFGVTSRGHHFIAMEYVDGTDLHQLIRNHQLDPEGALNAISQICDALEYAHSEGFVHRDIKPANMFINSKGILKVGDFGLAKLVEEEVSPVSQELMGLTMTGVAMGTPHYIAPEQLEQGVPVDRRADIYSLGIMFYEMLTGEIPRGAVKSPSEKSKNIDVRIDGVVFKAMESDPGDRYQTATDLRTDVDVIRTTTPPEPEASPETRVEEPLKKKRKPVAAIVGGALALIVVIVGALAASMSNFGQKGASSRGEEDSLASSVFGEDSGVIAKPPYSTTPGTLHGLVYDKSLGKVVPLDIPAGWRYQHFHSVGAIKSGGETGTDAFSFWAIREDGKLFSRFNGKNMVGLATTPEKLVSYQQKVGVTTDGRLIAGPDFSPAPQGYEFVDARMCGRFGIALTARGDVHLWPAANYSGPLFKPPFESLKNVSAISGSSNNGVVLSSSGKVTQWHYQNGIIQKERTEGVEVEKISALVSLSKSGEIYSIGYNEVDFEERIVDLDYGSRILAVQFESGDWKLMQRPDTESEAIRKLIEAFEAIPKNRVLKMFVEASTPEDSAMAMWLEEGVADSARHEFPPPKTEGSNSPVIRKATKTDPYVNSLNMKFVPVPISGGETDGQTILFSTFETRVSDFEKFISENPDLEWLEVDFEQGPDHPAVRVQWSHAMAFCEWLTKRDQESGLLKSGEYYRLPSDHEWSCAAGIAHLEDPRATPEAKDCRLTDMYPWGEDLPPPTDFANYYGEETADNPVKTGDGVRSPTRGFKDGFPKTAPVGSFNPNPYGLFDMSGNVNEWCLNWRSDLEQKKTLRGTAWGNSLPHGFLSSARIFNSPTIRFDTIGFRCVLATKE